MKLYGCKFLQSCIIIIFFFNIVCGKRYFVKDETASLINGVGRCQKVCGGGGGGGHTDT